MCVLGDDLRLHRGGGRGLVGVSDPGGHVGPVLEDSDLRAEFIHNVAGMNVLRKREVSRAEAAAARFDTTDYLQVGRGWDEKQATQWEVVVVEDEEHTSPHGVTTPLSSSK